MSREPWEKGNAEAYPLRGSLKGCRGHGAQESFEVGSMEGAMVEFQTGNLIEEAIQEHWRFPFQKDPGGCENSEGKLGFCKGAVYHAVTYWHICYGRDLRQGQNV